MIAITECPRDAMQGITSFIPTEVKINYLNKLLKVGFDRLDFGSFVSPKAIPQLQDTHTVLQRLDLSNTLSKLLAIVANSRGAEEACEHPEIHFLGFPLSVSETFQQRNTHSNIQTALQRIRAIKGLSDIHGKEVLVYLSMAFGNPYGDTWNPELVCSYAERLVHMGIEHVMLADTTGSAQTSDIGPLFSMLAQHFPKIDLGVHLHTTAVTAYEKIRAAFDHGCKHFDTALGGYGGCPMASDKLTGNLATETLLSFFKDNNISLNLNKEALLRAKQEADQLFTSYH